jgi:SPP1 gp7 family putative phage head morphogenesis protein
MEAQAEYYLILQKYDKREYQLGIREAQRLVKLSKKPIASKAIIPRLNKRYDLFATLRGAEQDLLDKVFIASQATLTRVDTSIKTLLTEGYQSGKGINYVANLLTKRFDQLTTWESKRIARTEIHNSHNTAVMDTYQEYGVEYTMWIAADDERTRESHLEINGEIIPMGGTYSNGLKYPGDTDGPIEEWINCRCSNAPYVIPYGYTAPPFSPFREEDLIPIKR